MPNCCLEPRFNGNILHNRQDQQSTSLLLRTLFSGTLGRYFVNEALDQAIIDRKQCPRAGHMQGQSAFERPIPASTAHRLFATASDNAIRLPSAQGRTAFAPCWAPPPRHGSYYRRLLRRQQA